MSTRPTIVAQSDGAPFIAMDYVISAGFVNGVILVNIGAQDLRVNAKGNSEPVIVPTAHIRMSPYAANELVSAIQKVANALKEENSLEIANAATSVRQ